MRRISVFVLAAALAIPAIASAQAQDPLVVSARQHAQQGNHDLAISLLRGALATRPADAALKTALADVLSLKIGEMNRQLVELRRELTELRGERTIASVQPGPVTVPGCPTTAPVRVGGSIGVPRKDVDVKPVYPPAAQEAKVQGIVIVEAIIDCTGSVINPRVLRGQPMLNDAALEAVSQWKYRPVLLNGSPVPVIMTMTVTFRLE